MTKSRLFANNIIKYYGKRIILNNVHINIYQDQIVGILGPNGSGKTTLFYIIAGLIKPNSGQLFLDHNNINCLPIYRRALLGISYLPQDTSIFRGLTTEENILAILQLHEKNKTQINIKLEQILEEFKLTHIRKLPSIALSGGERRRVEIARAMCSNPKFILLDEPFAGVDPIAVEDLKIIITSLKNKGVGILITDHNVKETLEIVNTAYILYNGKIIIEGTKEDIINNQIVKEVYLGNNQY